MSDEHLENTIAEPGDDAESFDVYLPVTPSMDRTGATHVAHMRGNRAGFVDVVRAQLPDVAVDRRDEELQAVADQACAALADGKDADGIVAQTRSLGTADAEATDQATARELIKLAIDTTCPDQDRRVDEF